MKKYLLICLPLLWTACWNSPEPCQKIANDSAKKLITDYFEAISSNDFEELKNLSTPDYVLYEDGLIWNNDSLINAIQAMPEAEIDYELVDFTFEADCNGTLVRYVNHGRLTLNDTARFNVKWLESAYVKEVAGMPKLAFLHSSPVK